MGGSTPRSTGLGPGGRPRDIDCKAEGKTQLASPQPAVLAQLDIGDEMEIVLTASGACNALFRRQVAGTIIGLQLARLITCINQGHKFVAVVRSVEGAKCSVTIKNDAS